LPFKIVGVNDSFGESGKPIDLLSKYGLDPKNIMDSAMEVIKRK
jgi:transketolase